MPTGAMNRRVVRPFLVRRHANKLATFNSQVQTAGTFHSSTRSYASSRLVSASSKRPPVHLSGNGTTNGASVETSWYTSKGARSTSLEMGRYGLKRLNYATMEPPVWTIPPHPPTKSLAEKVLFPLTLTLTGAVVIWAYMNPEEEDMRDYWKRVETGQILVEDEDDDDYDYDDDDDDDEAH